MKSTARIITHLMAGLAFLFCLASCHNDEPQLRSKDDILGVWTDNNGRYILFYDETRSYSLTVTEQDGETIGEWGYDGYFYEPGYNLVIYIDKALHPTVYKIIELTSTELVWCPVEDLRDKYNLSDPIGEIIGDIIKDAQEGYEVNPELYEYYYRESEDEFLKLVDSLDLFYPWEF